jgi:hypothetical protein
MKRKDREIMCSASTVHVLNLGGRPIPPEWYVISPVSAARDFVQGSPYMPLTYALSRRALVRCPVAVDVGVRDAHVTPLFEKAVGFGQLEVEVGPGPHGVLHILWALNRASGLVRAYGIEQAPAPSVAVLFAAEAVAHVVQARNVPRTGAVD